MLLLSITNSGMAGLVADWTFAGASGAGPYNANSSSGLQSTPTLSVVGTAGMFDYGISSVNGNPGPDLGLAARIGQTLATAGAGFVLALTPSTSLSGWTVDYEYQYVGIGGMSNMRWT